jgi:hypothetical protein
VKTINVNLEGDYESGCFTMFSVSLESNGNSLPIFLTAKQTNLAIYYDDAFEPVLGLRNILLESGITINQTIQIINGDDSEDQMQFLRDFNRTVMGWSEEIQPINLTFSDCENPDNSNIIMESFGDGYTFTIYTETNEQTPTKMMNTLKLILSQD